MRELSQRSANLRLHLGRRKNEGIAEPSLKRNLSASGHHTNLPFNLAFCPGENVSVCFCYHRTTTRKR